jgi:hypothetical protein
VRLVPTRIKVIVMGGTIVVMALLVAAGIYFGNQPVEGSHTPPFLQEAEWGQPVDPHPKGWDCWVLRDPEAQANRPYLIWCDTEPKKVKKDD